MKLHALIANKVQKDPSLVNTAWATLRQWDGLQEAPPQRLAEWRRILRDARRGKAGLQRLLTLLRDDSEGSRRLLDYAPFAGVLTQEERRKVFLKCRYDH